jgi:hypothetical protein
MIMKARYYNKKYSFVYQFSILFIAKTILAYSSIPSSRCYAFVAPHVGLLRRRPKLIGLGLGWSTEPWQGPSKVCQGMNQHNSRARPFNMCICIHCAHVTNCSAYHFVEEKHEQPHMTEHPTFIPVDGSPTIHVNIRTTSSKDPVARIWAEHREQQSIAARRAAEKGTTDVHEERGEKVYDLSTRTTYEYDVVKCESYLHDEDCWVRNMPEAIKLANPTFVPS